MSKSRDPSAREALRRVHPRQSTQRGHIRRRAFYLRSADEHLSLSGQSDHAAQAPAPAALDLGVRHRQGHLPGVSVTPVLYSLSHSSHYPSPSTSIPTTTPSHDL